MTHAIIYDRASTKNQKDNYSRVNAHEVGIRIAEQNGFTWEYIKEIGSGATLTGRPEMMRILDRIAAGEIQALIVQDLDRLARPEEAVVYSTIRGVIMEYNVIIYTHTSRIDLNNDDDDFVADITMSVAKKERKQFMKRSKRATLARAEAGKFTGGKPGLGYAIEGYGSDSDAVKNPEETKIVKLIFDTLEETGGNLRGTANRINEMGYRGRKGNLFSANAIRRIAKRKIYMGIFTSSLTDKVIHRPDLQIISIEQFERVQSLIEARAGNGKDLGRRGHYIFTGFVVCGNCGGSMIAAKKPNSIMYVCQNRRLVEKGNCSKGKSYTEHLILPPIVNFIADLIQNQLDFQAALDNAATQYGKSVTEEAIEVAIQGELTSVQAGKQRIIESISLGIITNDEAGARLEELREQEQRLTVELASIAEKTAILEEWQKAVDFLKGHDLAATLLDLAKDRPLVFRRLLSLVFEPNSLRVRTERRGNFWIGVLEDYKLTEALLKTSVSFCTNPPGCV